MLHIFLLFDELFDIDLLVGAVSDRRVELGFVGGYQRLKVHEILCKSPSFVETGEPYHTSSNDF